MGILNPSTVELMVTNVGAGGRVKTNAVCVQQIHSSLGRGISVLSVLCVLSRRGK